MPERKNHQTKVLNYPTGLFPGSARMRSAVRYLGVHRHTYEMYLRRSCVASKHTRGQQDPPARNRLPNPHPSARKTKKHLPAYLEPEGFCERRPYFTADASARGWYERVSPFLLPYEYYKTRRRQPTWTQPIAFALSTSLLAESTTPPP